MTSNINLYQDLGTSQLETLCRLRSLPKSTATGMVLFLLAQDREIEFKKNGKAAEESTSKAFDAAGAAAESSCGSKWAGSNEEKCFFDWDLDGVEKEMEKATQSKKKKKEEEEEEEEETIAGDSGGLQHGVDGEKKDVVSGLSTMSIKEKSTAKEEK
ncbi:hypothetical protein N0V94_007601 [Neodidymelliopsis sp. IMI 364377]|nr:hypothetical protein N0V94_007601 [Neodidymelliopsis sp. IMI 364377]